MALRRARKGRYPERDRVMVLLSLKAGLRAGEIAKLTWPMVSDPDGGIGKIMALHDVAAKKGGGRTIPLHPALRAALVELRWVSAEPVAVVASERGGPMRPSSVVNWFALL
jgi:integrase/recombinase XerD